jgi:CHASE3 domain sensor protein
MNRKDIANIVRVPSWLRELVTYVFIIWMVLVGIWVFSLRNLAKINMLSVQNVDLMDKMYLDVKAAESGKRGYLITGDQRYLAEYMAAISSVRGDIRILNEYLADRKEDKSDLKAVSTLVDQKLDEMDHVLKVYETLGQKASFELVANNQGFFLAEAIRDAVERIKARERNFVRHRMMDIF